MSWSRYGLATVVLAAAACSAANPLFSADADSGATPGTTGAGADTVGADAGSDLDPDEGGVGTLDGADDPDTDTDGPQPGDNGEGPVEVVVFTDDAWAGEFAEGTVQGLQWVNNALRLEDGLAEGVSQSRIFDASATVSWATLEWTPRAPYGKPLPDAGTSESGYVRGNAQMDFNILLLHLDDIESDVGGLVVADASGAGHDGFFAGVPQFDDVADGVFGRAMRTYGVVDSPGTDSHVRLPVQTLAPGDKDFTWSLWFRDSSFAPNGSILMSMDSPSDMVGTPSVWIACEVCAAGELGVGFAVLQPNAVGPYECTAAEVDDGQWHHVALVKSGHEAASISLYLDGEQVSETEFDYNTAMDPLGDVEFTLGGSSDASFAGQTDLDEVAIWVRAFSAGEVRDLYLRGAAQLGFRVRGCEASDCSDEPPFVGPGGDPTRAFSDPRDALMPGSVLGLDDIEGRYVQYEVRLQTTVGAESPALESVTLRGE